MIKLFYYEGYEVKVSPEALKLKQFKKIWLRDKTKEKERATMELAFIYFFGDPRSDYQYITDEDDRVKAIVEGEGLPKNWKPDKDLTAAIDYYKSFLPESALLLQDAIAVIDKLRTQLKNISVTDIKDIKTVADVLKLLPTLIKQFHETETLVFEQMRDTGEARGSMEKTLLDDGLDDIANRM